MVMRNRHDGGGTPQWWDDLPPRVRSRFSNPPAPDEPAERTAADPRPTPTRREIAGDLSRLVLLFAAIAIANLLFLLVAVSFLTGR
jgi:hypothetical protein